MVVEVLVLISCADPGIFMGGGGVQVSLTKKALFFLIFYFIFLVLNLFYRSQMANFKEISDFSRFQSGSNFFQGGVQLFPGGSNSNCFFPKETHITCDFPGGPDPLYPPPPYGSALV